MIDLKDELIAFFSKSWALFLYVIIGLIGKLSYDLLYGRKMTWWQVIASIGIALFTGFVAAAICTKYGWEDHAKFVVPIATLLSEKLIVAAFSLDYKGIFADLVAIFTKNRQK